MGNGSGWRVPDRLGLPHPPVIEDRSLPHQIRLTVTRSHSLALGCNCTADPIEVRSCWADSEQIKAHRAWHEQRGILL
jgi:hypothetical protein